MNLIDYEHYRRTRKIILYETRYSNDNDPNWVGNFRYLYSETGETLEFGSRGQLVVVDSHGRCSCEVV